MVSCYPAGPKVSPSRPGSTFHASPTPHRPPSRPSQPANRHADDSPGAEPINLYSSTNFWIVGKLFYLFKNLI